MCFKTNIWKISFLQAGLSGMGKGLSLKMLHLILKRIGVLASPGSGFGSLSPFSSLSLPGPGVVESYDVIVAFISVTLEF